MFRSLARQTLYFATLVWSLFAALDLATTIIGLHFPNVVEANSLLSAYTGIPFLAICVLLKLIGLVLLFSVSSFFVWLLNRLNSRYAFLGTLPFWISAYSTASKGVIPNLFIIHNALLTNRSVLH